VEIKKACKTLKLESHPDKNNGAGDVFEQVNEACVYFQQREDEENLPRRIEAVQADRTCTGCMLDGANFDEQDLQLVDLARASLKNTSFQSSTCTNSIFDGAELVSADFNQTNLNEASFIDAQIKSRTIDEEGSVDPTIFKDATALGAKFCESFLFGTHFENTALTAADFNKATISYCWFSRGNASKVNFRETTIHHTSFGGGTITGDLIDLFENKEKFLTNLKGAAFNHARIENSSFTYCNLNRTSFKGAQISDCTFLLSDLTNARFDKVRAQKTDFEKTHLINTNFNNAELQGCGFRCAVIENIQLKGAHLDGADFRGATIKNVDFTECSLKEVNFEGAQLQENVIFTKEEIKHDAITEKQPKKPKVKVTETHTLEKPKKKAQSKLKKPKSPHHKS
jgi:uncharacterized protein YjbI with pentapeptide repeats